MLYCRESSNKVLGTSWAGKRKGCRLDSDRHHNSRDMAIDKKHCVFELRFFAAYALSLMMVSTSRRLAQGVGTHEQLVILNFGQFGATDPKLTIANVYQMGVDVAVYLALYLKRHIHQAQLDWLSITVVRVSGGISDNRVSVYFEMGSASIG